MLNASKLNASELNEYLGLLREEFNEVNSQVSEFATLSEVASAGADHFKDKTVDGSKALEYLD